MSIIKRIGAEKRIFANRNLKKESRTLRKFVFLLTIILFLSSAENLIFAQTKKTKSTAKKTNVSGKSFLEWSNEADKFIAAGEFEKAVQSYSNCLKALPTETHCLNNRGVAYQNLTNYEAVIKDFTKLISLRENLDSAYLNRGYAYYLQDKFDLALQDFDILIKTFPDKDSGYGNRGVVFLSLGKYDAAAADFEKASQLAPSDLSYQKNLSTAYLLQTKYDEAIKILDVLIEKATFDSSLFHNRGTAFYLMKNYEKAVENFNQSIKLNPNYTDSYITRAISLCKLGKTDLAKADEQKVLQLGGSMPELCE